MNMVDSLFFQVKSVTENREKYFFKTNIVTKTKVIKLGEGLYNGDKNY